VADQVAGVLALNLPQSLSLPLAPLDPAASVRKERGATSQGSEDALGRTMVIPEITLGNVHTTGAHGAGLNTLRFPWLRARKVADAKHVVAVRKPMKIFEFTCNRTSWMMASPPCFQCEGCVA